MRIGLLALLATVAATTGNAFTASTGIPGSSAGAGSAAISGYAAGDIAYTPSSADPTTLASVSFTIAPGNASQVFVRLVSNGGAWYPCSVSGAAVTCPTVVPSPSLEALDSLDVVAGQ